MQTFVFSNGCLKDSRISNIPLGLGLEFGLGLGLGLGLELGLGLGLELWLLNCEIENNIWRHLLNILNDRIVEVLRFSWKSQLFFNI